MPFAPSDRKLPALAGAKALSNHYMEVTFAEAPGEEAGRKKRPGRRETGIAIPAIVVQWPPDAVP